MLGVVALCTDSLSADDFLPAMASVLPRAALRHLASDAISVTNCSWREDFEDMWLFHFVASIGLMAQLASAYPASASQSAAASQSADIDRPTVDRRRVTLCRAAPTSTAFRFSGC